MPKIWIDKLVMRDKIAAAKMNMLHRIPINF